MPAGLAHLSELAFHEQDYQEALAAGRQAFGIFEEVGDVTRTGNILVILGDIYTRLGQWQNDAVPLKPPVILEIQVPITPCQSLSDLS